MGKAQEEGGTANLIGPLDKPHEFVFVPDVGTVVVRLVDTPGGWGHVWHLAGAGVTTQQAIVDEIARQTGRPLKARAASRWMLRVLGLFDPLLREMVEKHYALPGGHPADAGHDASSRRGGSLTLDSNPRAYRAYSVCP